MVEKFNPISRNHVLVFVLLCLFYFPNIICLLFGNFIQSNLIILSSQTSHTHSPTLVPLSNYPLANKKIPNKQKTRKHQVQLELTMCMIKLLVSAIKEAESFPTTSRPGPKPSTVKSYTSTSLLQFLWTPFNCFMSGLFPLGEGERLSQWPSVSLILF